MDNGHGIVAWTSAPGFRNLAAVAGSRVVWHSKSVAQQPLPTTLSYSDHDSVSCVLLASLEEGIEFNKEKFSFIHRVSCPG